MDENMLLNLALDAGEIMLASGAETQRVEDTMERILSVSHSASIMPEAFATTTGLFAGAQGSLTGSRTRFKRILHRSTNLGKITRVNSMSRDFVAGKITIEEAFDELAAIHELKDYSFPVAIASYGIVCGSFSLMFQGSFLDAITAFFVGLILGIANRMMQNYSLSSFLTTLIGSMLITFFSVFSHEILQQIHYDNVIIGCLMPLVPGVPVTNAVRDILEGNYISGTARITEASITAVAIAGGVGMVLSAYSKMTGGF